jgi:hypothetical protein
MLTTLAALLLVTQSPASTAVSAPASATVSSTAPRIAETRVYRIRQTVSLADVPSGEHDVRMWVPVPADGSWQHVLDRRVIEAPAGWRLEKQPKSGAEMVFATSKEHGEIKVVVETTVARQSPKFDMSAASGELQQTLFDEELRQDEPLMSVDPQVMELSRTACAHETDPARKVVRLLDAVADAADHYSKDPSKPKCGRGSAQDCLLNGGGCCTDLHSLFIAAARAAHVPARMQYGYRLNATKEKTEYDPSYRCWVEFYLPGSGWVPTDLVVADAGEPSARMDNYGTLDARRVWLWAGRGLDLVPKQASAPIETMSCGWAEIDGVAVNVLPAADGSPSKLTRKIVFEDLTPKAPTVAK